jgi:hypothetical protein
MVRTVAPACRRWAAPTEFTDQDAVLHLQLTQDLRRKASAMTFSRRQCAGTERRLPFQEPIGVRAALAIMISFNQLLLMVSPRDSGSCTLSSSSAHPDSVPVDAAAGFTSEVAGRD